jgi:hypothetical protein
MVGLRAAAVTERQQEIFESSLSPVIELREVA